MGSLGNSNFCGCLPNTLKAASVRSKFKRSQSWSTPTNQVSSTSPSSWWQPAMRRRSWRDNDSKMHSITQTLTTVDTYPFRKSSRSQMAQRRQMKMSKRFSTRWMIMATEPSPKNSFFLFSLRNNEFSRLTYSTSNLLIYIISLFTIHNNLIKYLISSIQLFHQFCSVDSFPNL